MPGAPLLDVSVYDYDSHGDNELIGSTSIDLIDRWYSPLWQTLGKDYQDKAGYSYSSKQGDFNANEGDKVKIISSKKHGRIVKVRGDGTFDVQVNDGKNLKIERMVKYKDIAFMNRNATVERRKPLESRNLRSPMSASK